ILVDFLVDVQKPADRNVYYKFDWEGTYNMVSPFQNLWDNCPAAELPDDYEIDFSLEFCYITEQSPQSINILSTEGFIGDVFRGHKLASLDPNKRFLFTYSMQAKQYSLSRRAYNYLKSINDQASNVGGLFDPPPAMIPGNIRVLNDEDAKAFGFFFVSSVNRFRDFFDASIVPVPLTHYETCDCYPAVPACLTGDEPDPVMPYCCDCRFLPNSTTVRPDYWIN
ncbi:MAG TPA: DUF4249 family protein, partial [Cyclobacteriaceae bacterium]|nr:DUF4249 family protein [Cyclobacteriaceae bacterium]